MLVEGKDFIYRGPTGEIGSDIEQIKWRINNAFSGLNYYQAMYFEGGERVFSEANLSQAPVSELRMLYALTYPYDAPTSTEAFGSMFLKVQVREKPIQLIDATDPLYSYAMTEGEKAWVLDFIPFGVDIKIPEFSLESMYLAYLDLARLISVKRGDPNNPAILVGSPANALVTNFGMRHFGLHLATAIQYQEKAEATAKTGIDAVEILQQTLKRERQGAHVEEVKFLNFIKTEDLLGGSLVAELDLVRSRLYRRMSVSGGDVTDSEEGLEKELRIKGISYNIAHLGAQKELRRLFMDDETFRIQSLALGLRPERNSISQNHKKTKKEKSRIQKDSRRKNRRKK